MTKTSQSPINLFLTNSIYFMNDSHSYVTSKTSPKSNLLSFVKFLIFITVHIELLPSLLQYRNKESLIISATRVPMEL